MDPFIQVELQSVRVDPKSGDRVIVLTDTDRTHYLAIWASKSTAKAIVASYEARYRVSKELYLFAWKLLWCLGSLRTSQLPFQDTTNLLERVRISMGSAIEQATITGLLGDVYLATLTLRASVRSDPIKMLPSHALVLAIGQNRPVYVPVSLLKEISEEERKKLHINLEKIAG